VIQVPRDDRSVIGQWWWTVDRWALSAILAIMAFGVLLTVGCRSDALKECAAPAAAPQQGPGLTRSARCLVASIN